MYKYILLLIIGLLSCQTVKKGLVTPKTMATSTGWEIPYNIYYPEVYGKKNEKVPLFLFLHGAGERGSENKRQLIHVAPYVTSPEVQSKFPAVFVFPQCPKEDYWAPVNRFSWTMKENGEITPAMAGVIQLMERLLKDPKIDKNRVYVGGLSMGGFGTFDLLSRKPEWFAAAVPICGGADLTKIGIFKDVPIWVFHGAKDDTVPAQLSRDFVKAMAKEGVNVRYTEYPEGKHNVWNDAVKDPELLQWMFSQVKVH